MDPIQLPDLGPELKAETPDHQSPAQESTFSHPSERTASSTTSLDTSAPTPPTTAATSDEPKKLRIPVSSHAILKARLEAKITAMRAARKADGPDGVPIRTRAELLETRRRKADARKAHKKELRKLSKEEARADAERQLAQLRGSDSPLGDGIFTPPRVVEELAPPRFSFGRIEFGEGEVLDANGNVVSVGGKKGAVDAKSALTAAQRKAERLARMDPEKRADIESKELWLNAKKRAHGEKVKDDVGLLKKAVKRQEKMKSKSEKEWKTREYGVKRAQQQKQQKREENLAKRREEKGKKKFGGGKLSEAAKKKKLLRKAFG